MSKASSENIKRFNDLMKTAYAQREDGDHAFVMQFAKTYLHGKKSKHIMRDSMELWESYVYWEREQKAYQALDSVPNRPALLTATQNDSEPVIEVVGEEEQKPKKKKKGKRQRDAEEEMDEPEVEQGEPGANTPRSKMGDLIATLDASGRLDDDTAGRMLRDRDAPGKWKERAGLAAKLSLGIALATGAVLGVRGVIAAKKAAENVGGEVQKIQDNVGNMADGIATDPHGAAMPQRGQDAPQEGSGKHAKQLKDRAKDAPPGENRQKGR